MDERAGFEERAVLSPRRARLSRLALVLPAITLAAIAWAGVSGARPDQRTAGIVEATALAAPSLAVDAPRPTGRPVALGGPRAQPPAQVVGLDVEPLEDVRARRLGRDDVVAIAGWYVATAITDCPPLAAIYREAALPEVRGDADELAFCERSGVLFNSRPDRLEDLPTNYFEDNRSKNAGLPAVPVTLVIGVIVPLELELVGGDATEVVVVGRFAPSGDGCGSPAGCGRVLVVDHVAWTPIG